MSVEPTVGSIARAARALEILASAGEDCSLSELSERTVFSTTTTHRVLGSLQAVRYVSQDLERRTLRLGIGAGSLAHCCAMPKERRAMIGRINKAWLDDYGASPEALEAQATDTEARGDALDRGGVVPGMSAVALPVVVADGEPVAGLAIDAINDRMTDDRITSLLLPALHEEVTALAARINCWDGKAEMKHGPASEAVR